MTQKNPNFTETHVNFTGCKYLDYETHYIATMALVNFNGDAKVCWERRNPEGRLVLCQFCTKIGRLNAPRACLSERGAMCHRYEETEHSVPMADINM